MVEMAAALNVDIKRIAAGEPQLMDQMLDLFAVAFEDAASYSSRRPSREYTTRLLASESFIALVALHDLNGVPTVC